MARNRFHTQRLGSVDSAAILDDTIDSADYAAGSIDNEHLAANSVDSDNYVDGSIDNEHLADNAVDSEELASGAVDPDHIAGLADTAATVRIVQTMLMRLEFDSADFDANDDLTITFPAGHDVLIHDVYCHVGTLEGGALSEELAKATTGTLRDTAAGAGNALSSALDLNAATVQRTTALDHTNGAIAASGSVYFNASANPGTVAAGRLYIVYSHTT